MAAYEHICGSPLGVLLFAHAIPARTGVQGSALSNGIREPVSEGRDRTDERFVFLPVFQLFFTRMKMNKRINLRVLSGGVACG